MISTCLVGYLDMTDRDTHVLSSFTFCVLLFIAFVAGRNMVAYLDAKGTKAEKDFNLGIQSKSNATDFCTKVDVENEHVISNGIKREFPTHNIIGEEEVGTGSIPSLHPSCPTWIIDPIDGTTNFNAGLSSLTCVSIGFCHPTDVRRHSGGNELKNSPVMGVGKSLLIKSLV